MSIRSWLHRKTMSKNVQIAAREAREGLLALRPGTDDGGRWVKVVTGGHLTEIDGVPVDLIDAVEDAFPDKE
jgi:hypothetical protein